MAAAPMTQDAAASAGPFWRRPPVARCPRKWNWDGKGFYATLRDRAAAALIGLGADEGGDRSDGEKKKCEGAATAEADGDAAASPVTRMQVDAATAEAWRVAAGPTTSMRRARAACLLLYAAAYVCLVVMRHPAFAVAFGVLSAVCGGFGHNALHKRDATSIGTLFEFPFRLPSDWDTWMFELAGMGHDAYRLEHVMGHHMSTNTSNDPDSVAMEPLITFAPNPLSCLSSSSSSSNSAPHTRDPLIEASSKSDTKDASRFWWRQLSPAYWHLVAAAAAPFIFVCSSVAAILSLAERIAIVLNPTKPPQPPVSVAMRTRETYDGWVPLLTLFGLLGSVPSSVSTSSGAAREAIWLWLISWLVGSFYFMAITTVTHNQERNWVDEKRMAANIWRGDATNLLGKDAVNMTEEYTPQQDWGARQLQVSTDIALPWILGGDSRRGDPIRGMWLIFLHEQCLHHLFPTVDHSRLPALREVTRRTCREFGVPFPEPEPYGTLYLGMMRALAGMQVGRALAS